MPSKKCLPLMITLFICNICTTSNSKVKRLTSSVDSKDENWEHQRNGEETYTGQRVNSEDNPLNLTNDFVPQQQQCQNSMQQDDSAVVRDFKLQITVSTPNQSKRFSIAEESRVSSNQHRRSSPTEESSVSSSKDAATILSYSQYKDEFTIHRNVRQIRRIPCTEFGTCQANDGKYIPNCYCDDNCLIYNDCCFDSPNIASKASVNRTSILFFNSFMSCQRMAIPDDEESKINRGFYMITKCPAGSTVIEDTKCSRQNNSSDIPVTGVNGYTYKNHYCAKCHGVKEYQAWRVIALLYSCTDSFDFLSITSSSVQKRIQIIQDNCLIIYQPPSAPPYPRVCITKEADQYQLRNRRCKRYQNPIAIKVFETIIRNYMCLPDTSDFKNCVEPQENPYIDFKVKDSKATNILPMTVLFDFYPVKSNDNKGATCLDEQVSVKNEDECVALPCTDPSACAEEAVRDYFLGMDVILESSSITSEWIFQRAYMVLFNSFPIDSYEIRIFRKHFFHLGTVRCSNNTMKDGSTCCVSSLVMNLIVGRTLPLASVSALRSAFETMGFVYNETEKNSPDYYLITRKRDSDNSTCLLEQNLVETRVFDFDENMLYFFSQVYDKNNFTTNITDIPIYSEFQVETEFKPGEDGKLGDIFALSVVKVLYSFISLPKVDSIQTLIAISTNQQTRSLIIYFFMGTSMISLLATSGVFICFGLKESYFGHVSMNTIFTSMTSNVLFITGIVVAMVTHNHIVCSVVGTFSHYAWLCVYTWISIYTYLVFRIMLRVKKCIPVSPETLFTKKSIYLMGYGLPLLIILPCVMMELWQTEIKVGYGGSVCFPTDYPGNVIFFSGPILFSLCINALLLMVIKRQITKCSIYSDLLQGYSKVIIGCSGSFIRLCCLSGVSWILGITSQGLGYGVFAYLIYVVLGSQGIIISLCFLTSSSARRRFASLFDKSNQGSKQDPVSIELHSIPKTE